MAGMTYTAQAQVDLSTAEIYGRVLTELAAEHEDIVGLSADLANCLLYTSPSPRD